MCDRTHDATTSLRRARPDDLAALHDAFRSTAAMRYWSSPPHETLAQTSAYLDAMQGAPDGGSDRFIVEHDGRVIGRMGMWKAPELGFILHPDAWGRGLGTEAAMAFVAYAFDAHRLEALTADVDPRNAASLNLLARLGFREAGRTAGTFQVGDEWCDSVYLALSRTEWSGAHVQPGGGPIG